MEKKKNPKSLALNNKTIDFISPASFFKGMNCSDITTEKEVSEPIEKPVIELAVQQDTTPPEAAELNKSIKNSNSENETSLTEALLPPIDLEVEVLPTPQDSKIDIAPKIDIKIASKRVSGLSISSLKAKKEHKLNKKDNSIDESQLPKSLFTEEVMQKHWADFVHKIDTEGRKILASNLHADIPKLKDETTIWIEMPNGTMKKEIEREQFDLMEYLKLKLNNHFISLKITVNEETAKKFAFTPEEKYEKLREKNPIIDLLRKEFDLDL